MDTTSSKKQNKTTDLVIGLVFAAIAVIGFCLWLSSGESKPKTTFEASVANTNVMDTATLVVAVKVKNTGSISGVPSCYVQASDETGRYRGGDYFTFNEVKPGEEAKFAARLTVTNEGAQRTTKSGISC